MAALVCGAHWPHAAVEAVSWAAAEGSAAQAVAAAACCSSRCLSLWRCRLAALAAALAACWLSAYSSSCSSLAMAASAVAAAAAGERCSVLPAAGGSAGGWALPAVVYGAMLERLMVLIPCSCLQADMPRCIPPPLPPTFPGPGSPLQLLQQACSVALAQRLCQLPGGPALTVPCRQVSACSCQALNGSKPAVCHGRVQRCEAMRWVCCIKASAACKQCLQAAISAMQGCFHQSRTAIRADRLGVSAPFQECLHAGRLISLH